MKRFIYYLLFFFALGYCHALLATNRTWIGTTSTNGATVNDWNPSGVSAASDGIPIEPTANNPLRTIAPTPINQVRPVLMMGVAGINNRGASYSLGAFSTNKAGNSNVFEQSFTTASAPTTPVVISPANGSNLSNNRPTYAGTATPVSSVTVFVDDSYISEITADASGNWTVTPLTPLTDGQHRVFARASLNSLSSPNSTTNTFSIDTTPPTAPVVTTPANGTTTSDNTPMYAGSAEPSSTVTVRVNNSVIGTAPADASGNWSVIPTIPLVDGLYTVRATAADPVGNTGPGSSTIAFTIDTAQPTVSITSNAPNPTNTNPIPLTIAFSESVTDFLAGDITVTNGTLGDFAGSGLRYTVNVVPGSTGTVSVSVAPGIAQDVAGNGNLASNLFSILYESTPTISDFTASPDPVCVGNQVTFTANLGNLTGSYTYTLTNGTSTTTGTGNNADFSQRITTTESGIQAFSLTVSINGQVVTETYDLTVSDLPKPTHTISNGGVLSCTLTSLTLTATGGDDYRFSGPGILSQDPENGVAVINASGVYSLTVTNSETGCFSTTTTTVTSDTAVPSVSIIPSSTTLTCITPSVTLTANGDGSVRWSTGETSSPISVTQAGTYSVTLTSANGCTAVGSQVISGTPSAGPDYQPLVEFYNSTNGPGWTNKSGWLTNCDPCSWYGVGCTSGRVTSLSLVSNQLSGSIPESLTALTNLQALRLSQNQLTGGIPSSLSRLTNLVELDLDDNPLGGTIPTSLGALTKLRVLNLGYDQLTGVIPESVSSLPQLLWLVLRNNQLSGSIPLISSSVSVLYLNDNQLSGCFPSSLAASVCPNLQYATITLANNVGLPGGGSMAALRAFCNSGQGSDAYVPTAIASLSTACTGGVVSLSTAGGSSYSWIAPPGAVLISGANTSVASVSLISAGLQTFSVVISNGDYCSKTATVGVTVNQSPSVSIAPSITTLTCTNPSATLTANGDGSVRWSTGETFSPISVTQAGTYSVTVTGSNSCSASATTSISSNTVLSLAAGATLPQANVGVVVSLTASGAVSYQWTAPSTTSLTTPATGSTVSASLTTAGVQTFTLVASTGVCSQSALVSVTALSGPDLSAIISLPNGSFSAGERKGLLLQLQEVNGAVSSGSIIVTITVPTGYSVSFDNTLTSIDVSGGSTVNVQNNKWQVSNNVAGQQLSLALNGGETIGARATLNLGFTLTRTTANAGSSSNITVNVADDGGGSYDVNRLNNVYARIINGL